MLRRHLAEQNERLLTGRGDGRGRAAAFLSCLTGRAVLGRGLWAGDERNGSDAEFGGLRDREVSRHADGQHDG